MRTLLIILLLSVSVRASDCVPLTFATLTHYTGSATGRPVSFSEWQFIFLKKKAALPVELDLGLATWNERMPNNKLVCVYSTDTKRMAEPDWQLEENVPILWIGRASAALVPSDSPKDQVHCAIALFVAGQFYILHTVEGRVGAPYVESIGLKEFFAQTLEMYRVSNVKRVAVLKSLRMPLRVEVLP